MGVQEGSGRRPRPSRPAGIRLFHDPRVTGWFQLPGTPADGQNPAIGHTRASLQARHTQWRESFTENILPLNFTKSH